MKRSTVSVLFALVLATPAAAQTLVTATSGITFPASPDHAVVVLGVAKVDHYDLNVVAANAVGAIAFTRGLGKPTPDANNNILLPPIVEFGTSTPATEYVATVVAVGLSGDRGVSPISDPFARLAAPRPPGKPAVVK